MLRALDGTIYVKRYIWSPRGKHAAKLDVLCSSIHPGQYSSIRDFLHLVAVQRVFDIPNVAHADHSGLNVVHDVFDRLGKLLHVGVQCGVHPVFFQSILTNTMLAALGYAAANCGSPVCSVAALGFAASATADIRTASTKELHR